MKRTYFTPNIQMFAVDQSDVLTTVSGETVRDIGGKDLGISASDLFRNINQ